MVLDFLAVLAYKIIYWVSIIPNQADDPFVGFEVNVASDVYLSVLDSFLPFKGITKNHLEPLLFVDVSSWSTLVHVIDLSEENVFKFGVLFFNFKLELVLLEILTKFDESEIVL